MHSSLKKQKTDMASGRRSATIEVSPKYKEQSKAAEDKDKEPAQGKSLVQVIDEGTASKPGDTAGKRNEDLDNTRLINEVFDNIFNNDQNKFNLVSERNQIQNQQPLCRMIQLPLLTATDKAIGQSGGEQSFRNLHLHSTDLNEGTNEDKVIIRSDEKDLKSKSDHKNKQSPKLEDSVEDAKALAVNPSFQSLPKISSKNSDANQAGLGTSNMTDNERHLIQHLFMGKGIQSKIIPSMNANVASSQDFKDTLKAQKDKQFATKDDVGAAHSRQDLLIKMSKTNDHKNESELEEQKTMRKDMERNSELGHHNNNGLVEVMRRTGG